MTALRWTTGAALILTYGLIVLGAWVRATGSGLACPDWPTCYGHWVPLPGEIPPDVGYSYLQVMLEWVHRLIAGVILGPLILLIGFLAWRARGANPHMPAYAGWFDRPFADPGRARRADRAGPEQSLVGRPASRHSFGATERAVPDLRARRRNAASGFLGQRAR